MLNAVNYTALPIGIVIKLFVKRFVFQIAKKKRKYIRNVKEETSILRSAILHQFSGNIWKKSVHVQVCIKGLKGLKNQNF